MKIGDRLELVLEEKDGYCFGCYFDGSDYNCPHSVCENGIFKLLPKQNRITFENVDSNILCNDKGEPTMLNLYPLITAENRAACDEIYKTNKNVEVDIVVRWEK